MTKTTTAPARSALASRRSGSLMARLNAAHVLRSDGLPIRELSHQRIFHLPNSAPQSYGSSITLRCRVNFEGRPHVLAASACWWTACRLARPRRTAIALQVLFAVVAAVVVTASAPEHGADYGIVVWVVPITIVVSVVGLALGFGLRRRCLAT